MLNAGESIESLLGSDCKEPIFMVNPLFLHFCLWLLYSYQTYFHIENKGQVSKTLIDHSRKQLGSVVRLETLAKSYPAIEGAVGKNDTLNLKFCKGVLQTVKVLTVKFVEQLQRILHVFNPELANISAPDVCVSHINDRNITVSIRDVQAELLPKFCQVLAQCGKVHLQLFQTDRLIELSDVQGY